MPVLDVFRVTQHSLGEINEMLYVVVRTSPAITAANCLAIPRGGSAYIPRIGAVLGPAWTAANAAATLNLHPQKDSAAGWVTGGNMNCPCCLHRVAVIAPDLK